MALPYPPLSERRHSKEAQYLSAVDYAQSVSTERMTRFISAGRDWLLDERIADIAARNRADGFPVAFEEQE